MSTHLTGIFMGWHHIKRAFIFKITPKMLEFNYPCGLSGKNMNKEIINFENKEEIKPISKTLTSAELEEIIYKGESSPQDTRLLPIEKGGVFKFFNINDLISIYNKTDKFYPVIEINNEIIGMAELEESPREVKTLWIKFISIDPKYQNKRYSSILIEEIFQIAKREGFSLKHSTRTEEGHQKLGKLFDRIAEKYPFVSVIDAD